MSRKFFMGLMAASAALALAVPALASSRHTKRHVRTRHSLRLVMAGRVLRTHQPHNQGLAMTTGASPSSTLSYQGFACEVTIGQGTHDGTYKNHWTTNSTEFYVTDTAVSPALYAITTNCIGKLPSGTTVANHIVSHVTANCGQIDPLNSKKFIRGAGLTTTYPSGMYSESCSVPATSL